MDGIWQNGKYVLASTLEDRETRLRKENQAMKEALEEALHYIETPGDFSEDDHDNLVEDIKQALTLANGKDKEP